MNKVAIKLIQFEVCKICPFLSFSVYYVKSPNLKAYVKCEHITAKVPFFPLISNTVLAKFRVDHVGTISKKSEKYKFVVFHAVFSKSFVHDCR